MARTVQRETDPRSRRGAGRLEDLPLHGVWRRQLRGREDGRGNAARQQRGTGPQSTAAARPHPDDPGALGEQLRRLVLKEDHPGALGGQRERTEQAAVVHLLIARREEPTADARGKEGFELPTLARVAPTRVETEETSQDMEAPRKSGTKSAARSEGSEPA